MPSMTPLGGRSARIPNARAIPPSLGDESSVSRLRPPIRRDELPFCSLPSASTTDKKKEGSFTLEEIKPQLIEVLKKKKSNAALNKPIDELRKKASIEILISAAELLNP
jgi:hypothetical protein